MNRSLTRLLLLLTVVMVVPAAVWAVRGDSFAHELSRWQSDPPSRPALAALVVALLAVDVLLPVPSGPVSTLAGSHLGVALGTAASTLGMTLGASIAFALARRFARKETPAGNGRAEEQGRAVAGDAARIHGPWMLVLTRPLPIVAEAAAVLAGALGMPWRTFLPLVVLSNFALSAAYALLGQYAAERAWLPLAVAASAALPLAAAAYYRRRAKTR